MRWVRVCMGLAMLLFALGGILGCAGAAEDIAAREIVKRAPEFIGPADHYRAEVYGVKRNRVAEVRLVGVGVRPEPALYLDYLAITVCNVCYTTSPPAVTQIDNALLSARMSQSALNTYLQASGLASVPNVKDIHVTLLEGEIRLNANATFAGVQVPIVMTGPLEVREGTQLYFIPRTFSVAGVSAPGELRGIIERSINPVADLRTLPITPTITSLEIVPGRFTVAGSAEVPLDFGQSLGTGDKGCPPLVVPLPPMTPTAPERPAAL